MIQYQIIHHVNLIQYHITLNKLYHIIQYHSKRLNIILNDKISHANNYCILHDTISYDTISYHDSYCFMM